MPSGYRTVWWILAMGLADLLGIADLHCRKVESTKWLKHKNQKVAGNYPSIQFTQVFQIFRLENQNNQLLLLGFLQTSEAQK